MSILIGKINVKRVLDALSHMGYSTESAISDIVDNSVSANATEVSIKIKASSYGLKNTLEEVHIIDNGTGMDKGQLENCLVLGSSEQYYNQNSLSKFGMGLKSAGLSLGKRISVVSKKGSDFNKIVLDLEKITDEYNLVQEVPTNEDREVLKSFENGTHVKVDNLRKHHLTCKTIMSNLELEMSEIYCPMLQDSTLKIGLIAFSEEQTFDDKEIKPFDPLFESECQEGLNPDTWDGKTPCWLLKKSPIQIKEASTPIYITCTHLVHPPTFSFEDTKLTQLEARKKYRIGAGRAKFYIYRNNRLISRDYLGILTRTQSYYAFRGKIDISTEHDEEIMLDVKKSSIHFSEDLLDKIGDQIKPLRATSKNAWSKLSKEYNNRLAEQRNSEQREKVLEGLEGPYEKIPVDLPSDEKKKREKTLEEAYSNEQIVDIESDQETGKPEQRPSDKQTIEYVPALESDQIYRPYQVEGQVRINISRGHKFQQFLSDYLEEIPYEVQQAVEILFLSLAYAEVSVARNFTHQDFSDQEKLSRLLIEILNEFRHDFSTNLSKNTSRIARLLAEDT